MQVVSSMYKRNIQRLTQTYLTLSLHDIANTVQLRGPKEAEMHVLQMVGGDLLGCVSLQGWILKCWCFTFGYRLKMVRYMQRSTRRMVWLDFWRILSSIKHVEWLNTSIHQSRGETNVILVIGNRVSKNLISLKQLIRWCILIITPMTLKNLICSHIPF